MIEYQITDNFSLSMDPKNTGLNNNMALIGTPGSGKTYLNTYNITRMLDRSHVMVDVKGSNMGLLDYFERAGYKTWHFNLLDLDHSDSYSLFSYLDEENIELDLQSIAHMLYGECLAHDPFWDDAAIRLLDLILNGIYDSFKQEDRNIAYVNNYLNLLGRYNDDPRHLLKLISMDIKSINPNSNFSKMYPIILPMDSNKTVDCIITSLINKVGKLAKEKVANVISTDGIDFNDLVTQKTFILISIDDIDSSLHPICGLFLSQLLQFLFKEARKFDGGKLPIPIQFHLDDFGSYSIHNFPSIISTARSRNIGLTCIYQSQAQLDKNYRNQADTLLQCCDTILYFGGVDPQTIDLLVHRTGYTKKYIYEQPINSVFVLRRGQAERLERVMDLSSFTIPSKYTKRNSPKRRICHKIKLSQEDKENSYLAFTHLKNNKKSFFSNKNYITVQDALSLLNFFEINDLIKDTFIKPIEDALSDLEPDLVVFPNSGYKTIPLALDMTQEDIDKVMDIFKNFRDAGYWKNINTDKYTILDF